MTSLPKTGLAPIVHKKIISLPTPHSSAEILRNLENAVRLGSHKKSTHYNKFGSYKISLGPNHLLPIKFDFLLLQIENFNKNPQILNKIKKLSHHNIMNNYGYFLNGEYLYLVFDYAGSDLRTLISKGLKTHHKLIKAIVFQILLALQYLHQDEISYLNLSDSNVTITHSGTVKLIHPTALKLGWLDSFSPSKKNKHTWQSPEQSLNKDDSFSFKSDIFSLGLLLYKSYYGKELVKKFKNPQERVEKLIRRCKRLNQQKSEYSGRTQDFLSFLTMCLSVKSHLRAFPSELLEHKWLQPIRDLRDPHRISRFTKKYLRDLLG